MQGQPIREPPGCPPGAPPIINSDGEDEDYAKELLQAAVQAANEEQDAEEKSDSEDEDSPSKPTFLQQKMVALSGQNIDEFMKEMESVQKKKEGDKDEEGKIKPSAVQIEPLVPPGTDPVPVPIIAPQSNPPPQGLMFPGGPMRFAVFITLCSSHSHHMSALQTQSSKHF